MLDLCLGWARPVPQGSCSRHSVVCGHFGRAACSGQQPAMHFYCVPTSFLIRDFFVRLLVHCADRRRLWAASADSRVSSGPTWPMPEAGSGTGKPGDSLHSAFPGALLPLSAFFLLLPFSAAKCLLSGFRCYHHCRFSIRMRVGGSGVQAGLHCFFVSDCAPRCLIGSSVKWEEQCCTP